MIGLVMAGVVGLLWLTAPSNHSEAEDAWFYAFMTDQGAWLELFHGHHLLYLPAMRLVFRAAQAMGYAGGSFPLLTGISMLSGAGAVLLFFSLLRRMGLPRGLSTGFAAALFFSYGFWRYSTTVEIYLPVCALSLLAWYTAFRSAESPFFYWVSILAGGLALLLHLAALPAVLAVGLLGGWGRRRGRTWMVPAGALLIAAVGYGVVLLGGIRPVLYADEAVLRSALWEPVTWVRALIAWGQTLFSGNFLFGFSGVADWLIRLFPTHMLQEELYAGQQLPGWVPPVAGVTFVAAGAVALTGFFRLLAGWRQVSRPTPLKLAAGCWLLLAAGLAFCFEPANPEMWICVLPPFWFAAALAWNALPSSAARSRWPWLLAVLLGLHNGIGGILPVYGPDGDYCRQKGSFVATQAGPEDWVVTADSHGFVTWLQYQALATVLDAKYITVERFEAAVQKRTGRVFVFSDVPEPLPPVRHRAPESVQALAWLAERLAPGLVPLRRDAFGTLYEWSGGDE